MSNRLENSSVVKKPTTYGAIGLSIFLICFGFSYLMPNVFPEGSLFIIAGILILLTNVVKSVQNIGYDGLEVLFGMAFLVLGLNKVFILKISFIPVVIIVLAVFYLFKSINKLRNG